MNMGGRLLVGLWLALGGLALGGLALSGCVSSSSVATASPSQRLVGTVHHVNARAGFVVLRCTLLLSPGERVTVMREGRRVARLILRPESNGSMRAADIEEGQPLRGDWVVRGP